MVTFTCTGCGDVLTSPPPGVHPFRCRRASSQPDVDHVMARVVESGSVAFPRSGDLNPFIRYRQLLSAHATAMAAGMTDDEFSAIVRELDAAVAAVDGAGFRTTPFAPSERLAKRLKLGSGEVWIKDETGNVSGSHKARHLMGLMLYLLVDEQRTGGRTAASPDGGERAPLAIASCGNAALAAAVVAKAAGWPLDVFVPPSARPSVVDRLERLDARIHTCARAASVPGDPCYLAFRDSVAHRGIPFCCQGSDNGLTIEGGQTLAWEMVAAGPDESSGRLDGRGGLDAVFVQVGGGALASAVAQGFELAFRHRALRRLPRFHAVQTTGAYPLKKAYDEVVERILAQLPEVEAQGFAPASDRDRADLVLAHPVAIDEWMAYARQHRSEFMRPWPAEPQSIAHGILDDETYDWAAIVDAMLRTGGWPYVVNENRLIDANLQARETTGIDVDHTGSAGLAGLMKAVTVDPRVADERVAVIFSGIARE